MPRALSVTFVVMAGGRGERLWPLVRAAMPKVCLSPEGSRSLLRMTIDRLRPVWPLAEWLIVTTQEQAGAVRASLPSALRRRVLVEPRGKNTAACITLAAVALAARDPTRVMVVVPADHWIGEERAFQAAVRAAIQAAVREEAIVTIGVRPTHAHVGLGYLCAGAPVSTGPGPRVFRLARFIEKPSLATARRLIARPKTFWNSGNFVGMADTFLRHITEWLPEHTRRLVPLARLFSGRHAPSGRGRVFSRQVDAAYRTLAGISFDHGVMDHLHDGLVVEGRYRWADLGSWDVWARLGQRSASALSYDSPNVTVVGGEDHLVATVGVRDLVVVHTPSATLICHPDRAQAVREIVRRVYTEPRFARYR